MERPELGNGCACEVEEALSEDGGGKAIPLPAPCSQERVYGHRGNASHMLGASLDQLVDQTQRRTLLWYIGVPVQSSTNPGKPVHSLWQIPLSPSGGMAVRWGFGSPLTSPQLWLPGIPPRRAPELLSGSLQLCFQVVSPLGTFKRSLINSSCTDKSVFSTG